MAHFVRAEDAGFAALSKLFEKLPTEGSFTGGGSCADDVKSGTFVYEAYKYFGLRVEISKKLKPHGWQVLPKRWIVERTFSWLNHSRRLRTGVHKEKKVI